MALYTSEAYLFKKIFFVILHNSLILRIELPEIVGRIHPTKISKNKNNTEENEYRIYEDSNV